MVRQVTPRDGNTYSFSDWWVDTSVADACDQFVRHGEAQ